MVVNPEQSAASEISRLMRFDTAIKAEPFAKGRIDLVEFKVKENSPAGRRTAFGLLQAI